MSSSERADETYRANRDAVYAYCLSILRDPNQAEDATHEAFLRLLGHPEVENPQAWLVRVARNQCLDLLGRRGAVPILETDEPTAPDHADRVLDRLALRRGVASLSRRERMALHLNLVDGRDLGGVAASLGVTYAAAAQVVSRARRRLALALSDSALAGAALLGRIGWWGRGRERRGAALAPLAGVGSGLLLVLTLQGITPATSPDLPAAPPVVADTVPTVQLALVVPRRFSPAPPPAPRPRAPIQARPARPAPAPPVPPPSGGKRLPQVQPVYIMFAPGLPLPNIPCAPLC